MRVMTKKAVAGVPGDVVLRRIGWRASNTSPILVMSGQSPSSDTPELPPALGLALQLTPIFILLSHVLRHPGVCLRPLQPQSVSHRHSYLPRHHSLSMYQPSKSWSAVSLAGPRHLLHH
ncbi:hypothetical protein BKA70DRAFT_1436096 [Coprinopsis sp. MPI-PUGE-AT-0042]|nr:hypothetical protein BKA70DRAFT_1436096 [Coprinopsis sp. MPI-PUGE-AT-0042]